MVFAWKKSFGDSKFGATLVGNINDMKIDNVKNGNLDEDISLENVKKAFYWLQLQKVNLV